MLRNVVCRRSAFYETDYRIAAERNPRSSIHALDPDQDRPGQLHRLVVWSNGLIGIGSSLRLAPPMMCIAWQIGWPGVSCLDHPTMPGAAMSRLCSVAFYDKAVFHRFDILDTAGYFSCFVDSLLGVNGAAQLHHAVCRGHFDL